MHVGLNSNRDMTVSMKPLPGHLPGISSGGTSAVKEPGHFEVRKFSMSQWVWGEPSRNRILVHFSQDAIWWQQI